MVGVSARDQRGRMPAAALAAVWIGGALAAAVLATRLLQGALPVFTFVWLLVPLAALVRRRDAGRVGIRRVPLSLLGPSTLALASASAVLFGAFEPWSGAYRQLVQKALSSDPVDTTFGWLAHYDGAGSWLAFVLFGGLVTIFAEELFFRGWLLQLLCRQTTALRAVAVQAALFALLQALAATQLTPLRGALYAGVYAFVGNGLVGGWAAWRTRSIWPSLLVAGALNPVLTALLI
jgi:membrane protease YdiL (CAAX protease family)